MAKKEVKKRVNKEPSKKIAKKRSIKKIQQKTKIRKEKKKKPVKAGAIKKIRAEKKVAEKGRVSRKTQEAKEVKIPQKPKTKKRVKVVKVVKPAKKRVIIVKKSAEEAKKAALKRTLIKEREQIIEEAKAEISKYIRGETRQLVDTALDNGDWSVLDLSEDISLRQLSTHREKLLKIDEAIGKIDEGTYGKCEDCGEDISVERLKVLPFAIYCVDCQEKREQLLQLERERRAID